MERKRRNGSQARDESRAGRAGKEGVGCQFNVKCNTMAEYNWAYGRVHETISETLSALAVDLGPQKARKEYR